jgi:PAS domain S-box-containing protein
MQQERHITSPQTVRSRQNTYWAVGIGLTLLLVFAPFSDWRGSGEFHTVMEAMATLLAVLVGLMALVRYYSRPNSLFLFIGAGFLGTGFLDGFHTIVTSAYFKPMMPSDLPALIPWSWVASRQFLSILMVLSLVAWRRENLLGDAGRISERAVYLGVAVVTLGSFLFFAFAPLPRAYYPELIFHRPEEFGPALFFMVALVGYLRKGYWRHDVFEHWLVLSLIVGFVGQAVFMSHSGKLFDYEFDIAHTLKKVSYVCVLTGLLINMYVVFRREIKTAQSLKTSEERGRAIVDTIFDAVITIDDHGKINTFNPAAETLFGYASDEVIGTNVKCLMPAPYLREHDGYLENFRHSGEKKIIGTGREVKGLRKDGSIFPMDLAVREMKIGDHRMFMGVLRDITEQKQAETTKREFLSTVSHELRTPLTSIKGSLGLIKTGAMGELPDKIMSMLDIAHNNSERLVRLISDILDVEKIEAGKMDFKMVPMDMGDLLSQAIEANKGYGETFDVRFVLVGDPQEAMVKGDHDRLMQVLANLLSNAAKFSPEGADVDVTLAREKEGIRVSVIDQGAGIPENFQNKIFTKFSQADSSDTRTKGGTGLGLNISKAIVEEHGGTIGFETEIDEGTIFSFVIPALGQGDLGVNHEDTRRILICEDEPEIAAMLAMVLEHDGFETDIAVTAAAAKEMLRHRVYDAMTLDLVLPDRDGLSLLKDLRDAVETRDLPVIVISVKSRTEADQLNGDAIDVVDWMQKPIDQDRLLRIMRLAVTSPSGGTRRILHVEEDQDILTIVGTLVGDIAEMVTAETVARAADLLSRETFDLVILDLTLPDGDGEELLHLLKREDGTTIPVVVFSGRDVSAQSSEKIQAALIKSRTSNEALLHTIRSVMESGYVKRDEAMDETPHQEND